MTPAQQIEIDVLDIDGQSGDRGLSDRRLLLMDEKRARE